MFARTLLTAAIAVACAHAAPTAVIATVEGGMVGIDAREEITGMAEVTGTVTYRQRIALAPEAVVHVRLEDVSRAGAPATVIAEADVDRGGRQVPIPFRLEVDPRRIDPSHRYALRATIRSGERLLFASTTAHPVVPLGATAPVEIVVTPAPAPAATLEETYWKIVSVEGSPVEVARGEREPHLQLQPAAGRFTVFTGCNDVAGAYQLEPDVLRLYPGPTTLKACPEPLMLQERAILDALRATTEPRVAGAELELRGGGKVLVRLEAGQRR